MKKHKSLLAAIAVVGIALVAAAAWWLLIGNDSNKPKEDYTAAQKSYQAVVTSYGTYEKAFNTYSDGDYGSTANKGAYQKAAEAYQVDVTHLKATLNKLDSSELNDAYKQFAAQSEAFTNYASGYADDYQSALNLTGADCLSLDVLANKTGGDVLTNFDAQAKQCQADITALKASSNPGLAKFGTDAEKTLQGRRAIIVEAQTKAQAGDNAGAQAAILRLSSVAGPELVKNLADARQDITVQKSLEKLGKVLGDKTAEAIKQQ